MHDYDAYCDKPGKLHLPELGYRIFFASNHPFKIGFACLELEDIFQLPTCKIKWECF